MATRTCADEAAVSEAIIKVNTTAANDRAHMEDEVFDELFIVFPLASLTLRLTVTAMLLRVARIEGNLSSSTAVLIVVPGASNGTSPADHVNDEYNHRNYQQQVDKTPGYVEREPQQPENQKKRDNRPSNPHCYTLRSKRLSANICLNLTACGQASNPMRYVLGGGEKLYVEEELYGSCDDTK